MNIDNPFDRKLEATKKMPPGFREAFVDITDTLDFCWAAAQAVFGAKARPEHALALLPTFLARADAEGRRLQARFGAGTEAEPTPPVETARSLP